MIGKVQKIALPEGFKKENTIFLVDGTSFMYRAFFAMRDLSTKDGFPTGAIFGFTKLLLRLLDLFDPLFIGVVLDEKEKTERHEIFEAYKANRPKQPEDLSIQIPETKKIVRALGVKLISLSGFEADDIIATITHRLYKYHFVIITSDKDLFQLINDRIIIWDPRKELYIDKDAVLKKFGVRPEQMIDYQALVGDSTDNIPGVPGVGPKKAQNLLTRFGSLNELRNHLDELSESDRKKIMDHWEDAVLSKRLVELNENCPVEIPVESLKRDCIDQKGFVEILRRFEFKSLLRDFSSDDKKRLKKLKALDKNLPNELCIGTLDGRLLLIFDNGYYISDRETAVGLLKKSKLVTDDLKSILHLYEDPAIKGDDLTLALYCLDSTYSTKRISDYAQDIMSYVEVDLDDPSQALRERINELYNGSKIKSKLFLEMKRRGTDRVYEEIELPLVPILYKMEKIGIRLDVERIHSLRHEAEKSCTELTEQIFQEAGVTINLDSPKQLSWLLFERLKLPKIKKTKTGYSTDQSVLERLKNRHRIVELLLEYRFLTKLINTYLKPLPEYVNPQTKRLHTHFNQKVTATGRLSSSNPNLQNIPIRSDLGAKIRSCFVAEEGYTLVSFDYSQLELRILANLSKDSLLCDMLLSGEDVHTLTASFILGVDRNLVTKEMRSLAKSINYGIIYGMGEVKLSQETGITRKEARKYIDDYFKRFEGVKRYIENCLNEARKEGAVRTIFGRYRSIPAINSRNSAQRSRDERIAINTPIQGSAADIIKIAMIRIDRWLKSSDINANLILQIHDELLFEVKEDEVEDLIDGVKPLMEGVLEDKVPLIVDVGSGKNWQLAH